MLQTRLKQSLKALSKKLLRPKAWSSSYDCLQARSQNYEKRLLVSSCLSVRRHGITQLPLNGFSWNLIFQDFSKICWENIQVSLKYDKNKGHFTWRPIYILIPRLVLLRVKKNIWDKRSRETGKTHFRFNNFFYNL